MNLDKKSANQSRFIVAAHAFSCGMDLRLNQIAGSHSDHKSFCLLNFVNALLNSTKDLIIEHTISKPTRDDLAVDIE